jgi:LacI family transcriptional regulator
MQVDIVKAIPEDTERSLTTMSTEPGLRRPDVRATMRDVAALAGVGIKTVSRVINNEPNVTPATIARVRDAAARLDYHPDLNAGNLRRSGRRTRTLGLVVGSVANPFSGAVHRGVEDTAGDRGVAVFASSVDDDATREERIVGEMLRRRVDALILTTVRKNQSQLVAEQARGTVLVFIDREPAGIDADVVVTNNAEAAAEATAHLIAGGHRRLAYLGDRSQLWTAQERRRGFLEQLGTVGIPTAGIPIVEDLHTEDAAYAATLELLDGATPPTALFTSQNLVTIGALRALRERGLHRRVALVGFDDVPLGDMLEPGVTVVAQNPYEIGRVAALRAFARMDGDDGPSERIVVASVLIRRGSGEIPPGER